MSDSHLKCLYNTAPDSGLDRSEEGEYFLKVLIPSYAAGSIIGKGGQTIVQLQKETGATIKLSKSKDFYPAVTANLAEVIEVWGILSGSMNTFHLFKMKALVARLVHSGVQAVLYLSTVRLHLQNIVLVTPVESWVLKRR
ncbi:hypothetical protein KUCAC02_005339 [Chaenocephalus aceratus]|uniref:Uncharacterized protein n=1 Tax=Chaenocephalus aceratus TaxID=36190 RepID=A0ACB9WNT5_CHAAC|nr:hypothetical protein KUCAC02_005339 [Chaenocephalus aceratus]